METPTIEDLVDALQCAVGTKLAHDTASRKYSEDGGYEWGYHGYSYQKEMDAAAERFGDCLEKLIDARVHAILGAREGRDDD